jgi:hypothetical protein
LNVKIKEKPHKARPVVSVQYSIYLLMVVKMEKHGRILLAINYKTSGSYTLLMDALQGCEQCHA